MSVSYWLDLSLIQLTHDQYGWPQVNIDWPSINTEIHVMRVLWCFHTYVGSVYFLGVNFLNFNIFGGFQKNEYFLGMNILWIFFWGHPKIGLVLDAGVRAYVCRKNKSTPIPPFPPPPKPPPPQPPTPQAPRLHTHHCTTFPVFTVCNNLFLFYMCTC